MQGRTKLIFGWRNIPRTAATILLACIVFGGFVDLPLAAAQGVSIIDDGGSNDPNGDGQNDLTRLTGDDPLTPNFELTWSWDEPSAIGGGNTSNACAMFDTDGDGNVNYSFCVEASDPNSDGNYVITDSGSGADSVADFPAWIQCSDAKNDRCTQPQRLADPYLGVLGTSACTIAPTSTDPFPPTALTAGTPGGAGDDYPLDLSADCTIDSLIIPANAEFINVCSYPSAGNDGNNNPFDCVVTPGSGFLTIVKVADPDDTTEFVFTLNPAANAGHTTFEIIGSGTIARIPLVKSAGGNGAGSYSLMEAVPELWQLDNASCTTNGVPTGADSTTFPSLAQTDAGVTGIEIQSGQETICTFTNSITFVPEPKIQILKYVADTANPWNDANGNNLPDAGEIVDYDLVVTNIGNIDLINVAVSDPLVGPVDCTGQTTLYTDPDGEAPFDDGEFITCDAAYPLEQGDIDVSFVDNTASASGEDDRGNFASDSDTESVKLPQKASLAIDKSASPSTYDAVGDVIGYSFLVTNTGNVTISGPITVADDKATDESCPVGDLAPGASTTCTASYTITQSDLNTGSVTNVASASGKDPNGGTVESPTDTETVTAVQSPALTIVKTASPSTYDAVGDVIGYSFLVTNTGNVTISGPITVADDKATDESCPAGDLAPGASTTCTASYTITQSDLNTGSVTNVASASGKDPNGGTVESPTDTETVTAVQSPALTIVKTASPSTYDAVGDVIGYSFLVTNTGNVTISGPITVADDKATDESCPVGDLAPGASTTCTASYTITQSDLNTGSVTNVASASGKDPNGGTVESPTDTETVTAVQSPALTIVKTASPSTYDAVGDVIGYSFLVTNTGNVTISGPITVADDKATDESCPVGDLAPGASTTCTASYTITQSDLNTGSVTNVASASGKDPNGGTVESPTDTETVTAVRSPALTIVKTASPSTYDAVGDVIGYSFLVTNTGNVTISGPITVADDKATDESCPAGDLAPGASTTCTASYTITQSDLNTGSVTNVASASGKDPNGGTVESPTDTETVTAVQSPALTIVKTASPSTYDAVGDVIGYSFLVTNTGNVTISGPITVADDKATDESCPAGDLAPGASTTCTASYTITQSDLNTGSVTNVASASGKDPNGGTVESPTDTETVTAVRSPALTIVKTASPSTYDAVGDVIGYSFLVTNTGNVTISGPITVADDKATDESCPAGNLAPGDSLTCTASYTIVQADLDAGSVTNIASASGSFGGNPVTSPTDTETVTANQNPALSIDKKALDLGDDGELGGGDDSWVETTRPIMAGNVVRFQITVKNTGNVTIHGAKLVDRLENPDASVPDLAWSVVEKLPTELSCDIAIEPITYTDILSCGDSGVSLAPGQGFTVVVSATIPSGYFTSVAPGGKGTLGSNFEIDGNTQLDGTAEDLRDWNSADYVVWPDIPSGQADDSFGKGSKNDHATPAVVDGSIPNNKSDLLTMAAAAEGIGTANFVYLAWLRAETLGTVNIDFELNQSSVLSDNGVTPQRSEKDVIISFDFASGENVVQLSLRTWTGTQWSEPVDLDESDLAQGAVNDPVAFSGVAYPSLDLDGNNDIAELTFGEAVINATEAFGSVGCRTFNSVYVKSRSSTSFTAALKDFIAPQQVQINTCATIELPNTATVTSSAPEASDGAKINVTNDLAVAEAWRTAPID